MSVGNATQTVQIADTNLTLVLGNNLDLGGDGNRNGTGKCFCINTVVKLRNKKTGEVYETTVGELYNAMSKESQERP